MKNILQKYSILFLLLYFISMISLAQDNWTLSESFEFNDQNVPLSNDFWFGFDYPDDESYTQCGGTYSNYRPSYIHDNDKELNSFGPNNVYYYTTTNGEECVRLKIEKITNFPYPNCNVSQTWRSGMIYTKAIHEYSYGKFEIRCKLPKGKGFWPAFWLWNGAAAGEIDIIEFINPDNSGIKDLGFNFHPPTYCSTTSSGGGGYGHTTIDYSTDFHIFSAEWTPEHIIYRIDNNIFWEFLKYDSPFPSGYPQGPMRIIASVAVVKNGNNIEPDANTPTIAYMDIDYIRYYTENCENHIFCDNDNNNISAFKGYELQFAIPSIVDINNSLTSGQDWDCSVGNSFDFTCPKTINSTGYIAKAEKSITFNPGFTAESGSNFTAEIIPCASQLISNNNNDISVKRSTPNDTINRLITVYPNPNKGTFMLDIGVSLNEYNPNETEQELYFITVNDILGKKVYSLITSTNSSEINIVNVKDGIYFITIKNQEGALLGTKKLVIQ